MKLFVIGIGPLPFYRSSQPAFALSEGTWQIVQPLLEDGHQVRAVTLEFGQQLPLEIEYLTPPKEVSPNLEHQAYPEPIGENRFKIARQVQMSLAAFQPDAVISVGSVIASWITTQLKHKLPLWYDLKGAFLSELQLRMDAPDAEATFETFSIYKTALLRGDRFSAVTQRQADMVMGELGMVGRLNPATLNDRLVTVLPCGLPPHSPSRSPGNGRIRGKLCGRDDLVLFSSGGFNTWQDTGMFFGTVEQVLTKDSTAHFVCIGGGIGGHHDKGYLDFKNRIEASAVRDRCHLLGWVPQDHVIEYEGEADIGINCDLDVPESNYGDRSRFRSWMARGVAIATTPIPEPATMLVSEGMAIGLPPGNAAGAANAIFAASRDRESLKIMTQKAEEFVRTDWSYRETTKHLREWAANPVHAGDNRLLFAEGKIQTQFELGSLELALDRMFNAGEKKNETRSWKKVSRILMDRWPWLER